MGTTVNRAVPPEPPRKLPITSIDVASDGGMAARMLHISVDGIEGVRVEPSAMLCGDLDARPRAMYLNKHTVDQLIHDLQAVLDQQEEQRHG